VENAIKVTSLADITSVTTWCTDVQDGCDPAQCDDANHARQTLIAQGAAAFPHPPSRHTVYGGLEWFGVFMRVSFAVRYI
jgi:hypothetical protein